MARWRTVGCLTFCGALVSVAGVVPLARAADEGEKVFKEICPICHNAEMQPLDNVHLTREKWKETIERMIDNNGAQIPKNEIPQLLDYLVRTRGPATGASAPVSEERK